MGEEGQKGARHLFGEMENSHTRKTLIIGLIVLLSDIYLLQWEKANHEGGM